MERSRGFQHTVIGHRSGGWKLVLALVLSALAAAPLTVRADDVPSLCGSGGCQLLVGVGATYHYWAKTNGIVVPFIFDWGYGRYELGAFRFTNSQRVS